jgi:Fe-S-cluster-containing hydrogenase component 2
MGAPMSFLKDGILTLDEFAQPSPERLQQGRVAIIECVQEIPCNPCVDICPRQAITIEGNITNPPIIDFDKCNGCALCVANCPGLAIFMINQVFSETEAEIGIPYEFLPLPEKGESVLALGRDGKFICEGRVVQIRNPKAYDRTPIIFLAVPKNYAMIIRFFKRKY